MKLKGLWLEPEHKTIESCRPAGIHVQEMHSGKIILAQFAADSTIRPHIGCFINRIRRQAIAIVLIKKMGNHKGCCPRQHI